MGRTLVPLSVVGAIFFLPPLIQAQTDQSDPASVERIREALKRPPPVLQLPAQPTGSPTYRVEVLSPLSVLPPIDDTPFDPTYGLPSVGELLGRGIAKIGSTVSDYKQHRAERRARKEVDDALAAFCAVHECPRPAGDRAP
jgi:hypothetical protein